MGRPVTFLDLAVGDRVLTSEDITDLFPGQTLTGDQAIVGNLSVTDVSTLDGGAAVGTSPTAVVGFYGATPVAQPHNANQAAVSTATISPVATTGSTTTTPAGYTTTAQADAIVAAINLLITRAAALTTLVNQIRADLVTLGEIKGAA